MKRMEKLDEFTQKQKVGYTVIDDIRYNILFHKVQTTITFVNCLLQ